MMSPVTAMVSIVPVTAPVTIPVTIIPVTPVTVVFNVAAGDSAGYGTAMHGVSNHFSSAGTMGMNMAAVGAVDGTLGFRSVQDQSMGGGADKMAAVPSSAGQSHNAQKQNLEKFKIRRIELN